jgi:VCBS repeat-containing protein
LAAGTGDTGNPSFTISGNVLKTAAVFDFETKNSYVVRIRATDNGSPPLFLEQQFTITVTNVSENQAPVAGNDTYQTNKGTALTRSAAQGVLSNDTDPEHTTLTVASPRPLSGPANGSLTLNADGSFTYTPGATFVGTDSFTYQATDGQASSNTATVTIHVTYDFRGFSGPVAAPPTLNTGPAGRAFPVKFSLGSNQGLAIFAAAYPKSQKVDCSSYQSAPTDPLEETTTPGSSGLSYDARTGQYTYVWKTERSWAGTCRRLDLKLTDGTTYSALFKFN